jgi:hypothetical protein
MTDELERIWKEADAEYFDLLFKSLPSETEEIQWETAVRASAVRAEFRNSDFVIMKMEFKSLDGDVLSVCRSCWVQYSDPDMVFCFRNISEQTPLIHSRQLVSWFLFPRSHARVTLTHARIKIYEHYRTPSRLGLHAGRCCHQVTDPLPAIEFMSNEICVYNCYKFLWGMLWCLKLSLVPWRLH